MKKYVVIFGSLENGIQSIHGPFDNSEHAHQWASVHAKSQPYFVFPFEYTE